MSKEIWAWIGIIFLSAVLVLVGLRFARAEFKSNFNYSAVMEAKSAVVIVETVGTLPSGELSRTFKAIGFSIGNGYIVALSHATDLKKMFTMVNYEKATHSVGDDKLELVGRYEDISLFKSDITRHSIPFGDSDQLKYGTYIVIIGYSRTLMINIKDGIVSIPVIKNEFDKFSQTENVMKNTIMVTAPMNPGDSGSPVIAFREGRPEIVGIAAMILVRHQGMNLILKSNYVQEAISKILEDSK